MGKTGTDTQVASAQDTFLHLLASGISGQAASATLAAPLSDSQWDEVIRLAEMQTVSGIVFRAAGNLSDNGPSLRHAAVMAARLGQITKESMLMDRALTSLLSAFAKNGIVPVVQKGQGIARMYPDPHLRQSGDIDLYFRSSKERSEAERMISSEGITVRKMPDGSSLYSWRGIPVEHHARLTDLHRIPAWAESFEEVVWESDEGRTEGLMPAAECNLLLLGSHILKHAMGHGIGLRQFCDLAAAYRHYYGKTDYDRLNRLYKACALTRWNNLLGTVLSEALGLERQYLDPVGFRPDGNYAKLLGMTLSSGNFGLHKGRRGKGGTAAAFFRNAPFALKYAPKEYIYTLAGLCAGNIS